MKKMDPNGSPPDEKAGTNSILPFAIFTGTLSPRQLFISQKSEEINALYKQISKEGNIPGGGARQKAIKRLWDEADHTEWEQRAASVIADVDT